MTTTCPECERLRYELGACQETVSRLRGERDEARRLLGFATDAIAQLEGWRDGLESRLARVRAALEGTDAVEALATILRRNRNAFSVTAAEAILTALRERCFGAAPAGDEGKEGERG